jgi:alpha-D-ribose 1-methylphosphonate 5-triphosphate diphosphatase
MSSDATYLTGARVVLTDRVLDEASVLIADGHIRAIDPATTPDAREISLKGRYLLPGLVDLHCDAIEKEVEPRPNVLFPLGFAMLQIDRRNAAAGVTTPYHGVSFAEGELGVRSAEVARQMIRALRDHHPQALVDNRVHLRYEVTDACSAPTIQQLIASGSLDLISFMDHTPGQGQYQTLESYVAYLQKTYHIDAAAGRERAARKLADRADAWQRARALAAEAAAQGLAMASHDDDSPQRVAEMRAMGLTISECPTDLATAEAARATGMQVLVGSPNALRGRSQGGALSARAAITAGAADCLCSDYAPATLVACLFALAACGAASLPASVALASRNPATAVGLDDRGAIAPGLRADLIAVEAVGGFHAVTGTWVAGRQVFMAGSGDRS